MAAGDTKHGRIFGECRRSPCLTPSDPIVQRLQSDVETAAANVLDIAALIDPSKIVQKIKYHLLAHLREDVIRFGPLIGVATETYESFNAIFRFCSILSNHLAPSRDIALQLAEQEVLRHLLSGGFWQDSTGRFVSAGSSVVGFLAQQPFLQNLLGYGKASASAAPIIGMFSQSARINYLPGLLSTFLLGTVRLEAVKRVGMKQLPRTTLASKETRSIHALNVPPQLRDEGRTWYRGKHVISHAEDKCGIDSWVYANSPFSVRYLHLFLNSEKLTLLLDALLISRPNHQSQAGSVKSFKIPLRRRPSSCWTYFRSKRLGMISLGCLYYHVASTRSI